jgi:hypothetical protein
VTDTVTSAPVLASSYPPATRGRVVVWGLLAAYPFGGMTWQVLHYLAGLRRLGFDVWYVEDSDRYLYDETASSRSDAYSKNVSYMSGYMEQLRMGDRWVFRPPATDSVIGACDLQGLACLYRESDAVFNLCGAQELRPEHDAIPCRVFLETDPVQLQVAVAKGDANLIEELDRYQHLFTYGENFGSSDCLVPLVRYKWHTTRPPVCANWWKEAGPPAGAAFTTIANWQHTDKDVEWNGVKWHWSKDREFRRFLNVARRSPVPIELALGAAGEDDQAMLREHCWRLADTVSLIEPFAYRRYIVDSLGEFTVAKEQYVAPRSGWFSDRSVCYLAAGRPVVTQSTGFERYIPAGEGLCSYQTEDEAVNAIEMIVRDYAVHSAAASRIAAEYFDAELVIGDMLRKIGLL